MLSGRNHVHSPLPPFSNVRSAVELSTPKAQQSPDSNVSAFDPNQALLSKGER